MLTMGTKIMNKNKIKNIFSSIHNSQKVQITHICMLFCYFPHQASFQLNQFSWSNVQIEELVPASVFRPKRTFQVNQNLRYMDRETFTPMGENAFECNLKRRKLGGLQWLVTNLCTPPKPFVQNQVKKICLIER